MSATFSRLVRAWRVLLGTDESESALAHSRLLIEGLTGQVEEYRKVVLELQGSRDFERTQAAKWRGRLTEIAKLTRAE